MSRSTCNYCGHHYYSPIDDNFCGPCSWKVIQVPKKDKDKDKEKEAQSC